MQTNIFCQNLVDHVGFPDIIVKFYKYLFGWTSLLYILGILLRRGRYTVVFQLLTIKIECLFTEFHVQYFRAFVIYLKFNFSQIIFPYSSYKYWRSKVLSSD